MPALKWDIREVCIDPQPDGLRAVFMVGTRSAVEICEVEALFMELASRAQVRQLSRGKLISYAVLASREYPEAIDETEEILRKHYSFVAVHRSFNELIWRIVRDLAKDTGSKFFKIPACNICGSTEPFPKTILSLSDRNGRLIETRSYCVKCTAEVNTSSNKGFIRSLLRSDGNGFSSLANAEFVRRRNRKRALRFGIGA